MVSTERRSGFIAHGVNRAQYGIDLPGSLHNTDVVEKVNFLVAASKHGGTSVAEGSP